MNKPGKMERSAHRVYQVICKLCVNGPENVSNETLVKECGFGSVASMKRWIEFLKKQKLIFTKIDRSRAGTGWINRRYISLHEEVGVVPR